MAQLYSQKGELVFSCDWKIHHFFIFHSFFFFFPLTRMSGLHKGQNQGGTALLPGLFPAPVGLKCWLFHKEAHSCDYFVSQGDLSGPTGLRVIDNATKISFSQKSLILLNPFKFLLRWRSEDPKSPSVPLIWDTAMEQFLPTEQDRRGSAPEGLKEHLL